MLVLISYEHKKLESFFRQELKLICRIQGFMAVTKKVNNMFMNMTFSLHNMPFFKLPLLMFYKRYSSEIFSSITELENDSESVWVKVFANKTFHLVASWYRPPGGDLATLESQFMSFKKSA